MATMEILYYGRLRDEIGRDREEVDLPSHILTLEDLIGWLRERGDPYAGALASPGDIGGVVAGDWAAAGDSLFGAVEVALLPPRGVL
jgi:molybdopterin synthase sulfur carrier subunit